MLNSMKNLTAYYIAETCCGTHVVSDCNRIG